jgi:hypothetical protein
MKHTTRHPYKRHPARQVTMRAQGDGTPPAEGEAWPDAVQIEKESATLASLPLECLHPDWPFDGTSSIKDAGRERQDSARHVNAKRRATPKTRGYRDSKVRDERWSDERGMQSLSAELTPAVDAELNRKMALLSAADRSKLNRYAARELHRVPNFDPEEGSAAWGRACRYVLRRLHAAGLTLDDIEDDGG